MCHGRFSPVSMFMRRGDLCTIKQLLITLQISEAYTLQGYVPVWAGMESAPNGELGSVTLLAAIREGGCELMSVLFEIMERTWATMCDMAPYLLLGFAVAGILSVWLSARVVEQHLGGRGIVPVLKAALLGVPLPLCSCGVIPVVASLRRRGSSRGASMAFLISTPQTGADSILVTYSLLGPVLAVLRPVAALLTGLAGGYAADRLAGRETAPMGADVCDCKRDNNCAAEERPAWKRALQYGFVTLPQDIGVHMLAGLLLAGLIGALVPPDFFAETLGSGPLAMLVMMLLGIPVYVCATASVPIAAALIAKGVSPGAAVVFLMTGPATNAAGLTTVWKVLGTKSTLVYLGAVAAGAFFFGSVVDHVFNLSVLTETGVTHESAGMGFRSILALVLLGVLFYALLVHPRDAEPGGDDGRDGAGCGKAGGHGPSPPP